MGVKVLVSGLGVISAIACKTNGVASLFGKLVNLKMFDGLMSVKANEVFVSLPTNDTFVIAYI